MKLPAGWLETTKELGEGLGVLSHCGGPREWVVPLCGYSLTSYVPSVLEQGVFLSSTEVAKG